MSQTLESVPVSAPFQEAEVITNKVDNDGSHYLKVLLLSNKMTRNKWIAPYDKIGNLPKELIDSYMGLPYVSEHNYEFYDKLDNILYNSGLTDEQINKALVEECRKIQTGYIDHVFMDDPNSSLLYGQLKITDPKENEYISKYGRPSLNFTSPALSGRYIEDESGYKTYNLETIRAFHLSGVPIPAFPEHEAKVRGVCNKGNSESCKRSLAYAGLDPISVSTVTEPTENVNNSCGCNKNIQDMSNQQPSQTQQPQVTTVTTAGSTDNPSNTFNTAGPLLAGSQNSTQEAIEAARKEAQKVVEENNKKTSLQSAPKQQNEDENEKDNNDYVSKLKAELREFKQKAEAEAQRSLDQYNFFLDEILSVHIPKGHFKKEEDFNAEKESMKAFINKYNVNLQDAKWLIIKSAKGIPNQNEEQSGNNKKEGGKHGVGVAGLLSNPTTYNSDIITRPSQQQSIPKSGDNSINDDDDFPLGIE